MTDCVCLVLTEADLELAFQADPFSRRKVMSWAASVVRLGGETRKSIAELSSARAFPKRQRRFSCSDT